MRFAATHTVKTPGTSNSNHEDTLDDQAFFGAAFNANPRQQQRDVLSDDDDDSDGSASDCCFSSDGLEMDESLASKSFDNASIDSLDVDSLSISNSQQAAGTKKKSEGTPKKNNGTPKKNNGTPKKQSLGSFTMLPERSDLQSNMLFPDVFYYGGRRVAVMTLWIPMHYDQNDVSALVTDGGTTLTVKFRPPREFLIPAVQAATNDASMHGTVVGEAFRTYLTDIPSHLVESKLVFLVPFQAEEELFPTVLGQSQGDNAAEVVDIDLGGGRIGRQLILAVREVLREDHKKNSVNKRFFRFSDGGGNTANWSHHSNHQGPGGYCGGSGTSAEQQQQHPGQQQHHQQNFFNQHHEHQQQQQNEQQYYQRQNQHDIQTRGRVRPFAEVVTVDDQSIDTAL